MRRGPIEEIFPCGTTGLIACGNRNHDSCDPSTSLADCVVNRPKPFRLVVWEPLLTKAPGPSLAQPWCCYSNSIIFYHRPYIPQLRKARWRNAAGQLITTRGGFEEFDKIESRLAWDDIVEFEGERFSVGGGSVRWAAEDGGRRRWWMMRHARRVEIRT